MLMLRAWSALRIAMASASVAPLGWATRNFITGKTVSSATAAG